MKTLSEYVSDREHLIKTCRDMIEEAEKNGTILTDEQQAQLDNHQKEIERLEGVIAKVQRFEDAKKKTESLVKTIGKPLLGGVDTSTPRPDDDNIRKTAVPNVEIRRRYKTLKAFKGQDADERAYRAGQWARATLFNDERAQRWCMNHGVECRAMGVTNNASGGFIVPDEMSQAIIDLRETYGVFRQNCRVMPMGRDSMTIPRRSSGLTAYFVNENSEVTASDKGWDQVTLTAKKLAVLAKLSTELAEDAIINLADDIANEMAYQMAYKEDLCGFIGDGQSTYGGITGVQHLLDQAAHAGGKVAAASGITALSDIDAATLASLMGKLPQYARPFAKWYCSQVAFDVVFSRLAATAGGNTVQTISGAYAPSYLGYPIVTSQVLFSTTTDSNGSIALLFGALEQAATLGDRREITMKVSTDRYMEYDQIGILGTQRFDIVCHDVGDTTNAGAMVALELTT